jgi:uncharacterized protein YcfJ
MKKFMCATTFFMVGFVSGGVYGQEDVVEYLGSVPNMVYEVVEVCTTRQVVKEGSDVNVIGAIAGGLIGNQVGGGNGKTAATAVGAVIGSRVGTQRGPRIVEEVNCFPETRQVQRGEKVTFRYKNKVFTQVID